MLGSHKLAKTEFQYTNHEAILRNGLERFKSPTWQHFGCGELGTDSRAETITSVGMKHHDIDKKCQLIARFVTNDQKEYSTQVRQNLPVYLNTSDKVRLKISSSAITLADRTIWQRKLDRIPISLVRDSKIDELSPKICYILSEVTSERFQVAAFLCKSADDARKIIATCQLRSRSLGIYKKHNDWLNSTTFNDRRKSQSLGNEGRQENLQSNYEQAATLDVALSGQPKASGHKAVTNGSPVTGSVYVKEPMRKDTHTNESLERELGVASSSSGFKKSHRWRLSFGDRNKKNKEKDQYRSSVLQYDSEEDETKATKPKAIKVPPADVDWLQMNLNGVARIVVGGNDLTDVSPKLQQKKTPDKERVCGDGEIAAEEQSTLHQKSQESPRMETVSAEIETVRVSVIDHSYDNLQDGVYDNLSNIKDVVVTGGSPAILKKSLSLNMVSSKPKEDITGLSAPIREIEQKGNRRSSIRLGKDNEEPAAISTASVTQLQPANEVTDAETSDESDFEFVLAGLQKLTQQKPIQGAWPDKKERRYPHQIAAAQAVKEPSTESSCGGLHLVKNSPVRQSLRRQGQYQSIKEYEELQHQQKGNSFSINSTFDTPSPILPRRNRESVTSPLVIGSDCHGFVSPPVLPAKPSIISVSDRDSYHSQNHIVPVLERETVCPVFYKSSIGVDLDKGSQTFDSLKSKRESTKFSIHSAPHQLVIRRLSNTASQSNDSFQRIPMPAYVLEQTNTKATNGSRYDLQDSPATPQQGLVSNEQKISSYNTRGNRASLQLPISHKSSYEKAPRPSSQIVTVSPPVSRAPIIDGRLRRVNGSVPAAFPPQAALRIRKADRKEPYVALPNQYQPPVQTDNDYAINKYQFQQLENNPGFQRFFESIMKYGPVSDHSLASHPDIVADSISTSNCKNVMEVESDKDSSIRSTASAYWPQELQSQSAMSSEEFEDTASWKFQTPVMMAF